MCSVCTFVLWWFRSETNTAGKYPRHRQSAPVSLYATRRNGRRARSSSPWVPGSPFLPYHTLVFVAFLHLESPRMRRVLSAWCCLLGLFFFKAPVIGVIVIASGACCTGDHCPIAAHHHNAAKTAEPRMDCDQHKKGETQPGASSLQACSMSCCQTVEQSAVHTNVFVLSTTPVLAAFTPLSETVSAPAFSGKARARSPLSPPPKSLSFLI